MADSNIHFESLGNSADSSWKQLLKNSLEITLSLKCMLFYSLESPHKGDSNEHTKHTILTYSWLSLSRPRLSRITSYLEVNILSLPKRENLTTGKKYCGKEEKLLLRSNFSSFPQYFQYISNFKSPITYIFVKCGCSNYFFLSMARTTHV